MSRSKEEALSAGVKVRETQHNMKRRKPWHNYHHKGTYMLTLVVEGRRPVLGKLVTPAGEPTGIAAPPAPSATSAPSAPKTLKSESTPVTRPSSTAT